MKKIITKGFIIASCLFGMVTTVFAIPLSYTFSGTINEGVVWDRNASGIIPRNASGIIPRNVANDISGLDFMMTLTSLQSPPYGDKYGFNVEMVVPGYSFDAPGGDFYTLNDIMRVQETGGAGNQGYHLSYWGVGDHLFSVDLDPNGTGRIKWAAIGYSMAQEQRIGAYSLRNTDFTWTSSDNAVPVPEPGTMLLFCIGATGVAGYKMRKK